MMLLRCALPKLGRPGTGAAGRAQGPLDCPLAAKGVGLPPTTAVVANHPFLFGWDTCQLPATSGKQTPASLSLPHSWYPGLTPEPLMIVVTLINCQPPIT